MTQMSECGHPTCCEHGNLLVAMTALAQEFGAAAGRRVNEADQLSSDSKRSWTIAMQTPTFTNAMAQQIAMGGSAGFNPKPGGTT